MFEKPGFERGPATATDDHAGADKRRPPKAGEVRAAVVDLRDAADGDFYGFVRKAQLFEATASVLRYNCFPRNIAPIARRALKLPRAGYFVDFGKITLYRDGR